MENEELPSLEEDLAGIRERAAQARSADALAPVLAGTGGQIPGAPDVAGAADAFANSPLGKFSDVVQSTVKWTRQLPSNIAKGTLDAAVSTGRMLWDGL